MTRLAVYLGVFGISCGGGEPVKPANAPVSAASPTDKSVSQNTEKSGGDASRTLVAPSKSGPGKSGGPVPGPVDPPWLRRDMFPGATVKTAGRTAPNDAGLFSTQMLFELAAGTTVDACLTTMKAALAAAVPELAREEGKDGRVTLKGQTADYSLVAICGEAKGKPTAYISYEWLTAPPL